MKLRSLPVVVKVGIDADYFLSSVIVYHKIVLEVLPLMFFSLHEQKLILSTDFIFGVLFKSLSEFNELPVNELIIMQLTKNDSFVRVGSIINVLFNIADDLDSAGLRVRRSRVGIHANEWIAV